MTRYALESDLLDIMEMLKLCKNDMADRHLDVWTKDYPNEEIMLADIKTGKAIVNEVDGHVVSYLVMYPKLYCEDEDVYFDHSNYVYVKRVMVHPSYRRLGLAQKMISFVENEGYSSIRLVTRNTNTYSVNLYTKLGFKVVKSLNKETCIMQTCEKVLK